MDEKVEALSNLIDKIVKKEILLPDFSKEIYLEGGRKTGEIDSIWYWQKCQ